MANAFCPLADLTVNIDVSSSSARVLLDATNPSQDIRICNDGTATVWIKFGDATVTADVSNDIPVPAGAIEVLHGRNNGSGGLYVAAIAAGSTGKIYFSVGEGI
jgi:FlaG/FlaF family flagellin (archaellin)